MDVTPEPSEEPRRRAVCENRAKCERERSERASDRREHREFTKRPEHFARFSHTARRRGSSAELHFLQYSLDSCGCAPGFPAPKKPTFVASWDFVYQSSRSTSSRHSGGLPAGNVPIPVSLERYGSTRRQICKNCGKRDWKDVQSADLSLPKTPKSGTASEKLVENGGRVT